MTYSLRRPFRFVLMAACLLLSGCLTSEKPILAESADVTVADLSGTYTSRTTGLPAIVTREGNNRFLVKRGDSDPEEAILVPLDVPGTYLMQFYDGKDYLLAPILVTEDRVVVSIFAAAVQESLGSALNEADHFRQLAASLLTNNLKAILQKHGMEVDKDYKLLNQPTPKALVAFFNECVREPGTLTDGEVLTKKK